MTSRYEERIPPGWDRSDSAGSLIDIATGAPIRNLDHGGGWIRLADGTAIREDDPAFSPAMRSEPRPVTSCELLPLFT